MPAETMSLTALPACSASREVGDQRADRLGLAQQPHGDLGDDAERCPPTRRPRARRSGPTWSSESPPSGDHAAVGAHHREPEDMVGGEAVLQAVRAARVLRHVAADRADDLARRVGRVVQVVRGHRVGDAEVGHARLDDCALVLRVDGEDRRRIRASPMTIPSATRQRTAGQAGTRTAGDERYPFAGADPHDRRDLLRARPAAQPAREPPESR